MLIHTLVETWKTYEDMGVSKNRGGLPKSSHLLIGFSIIFTIHFGGKIPLFWFNTHMKTYHPIATSTCGCSEHDSYGKAAFKHRLKAGGLVGTLMEMV